MSDDNAPPTLRIVRGDPDNAEIAALTTVLASIATANPGPTRDNATFSAWADRSAMLRPASGGLPLPPGPNAWRASGLPAYR